jgi:hypothetical protein
MSGITIHLTPEASRALTRLTLALKRRAREHDRAGPSMRDVASAAVILAEGAKEAVETVKAHGAQESSAPLIPGGSQESPFWPCSILRMA